jgi:KaiC/GvpD/RAD55 family RecA-like ATPase/CheY-like chemotaxis protein
MDAQARKTIPSGIEPIDRLMGGLDRGKLYLVHGEAAGKSLFGILFLIAGLKRGEHVALVISSSPEDAVRRFGRLGYDCLEDIYSGRLVILDFSDDLTPQTARLEQLTPALREIEWLLGETRPLRLVFDPVTSVVVSEQANLEARVAEFARWTRSLGATVLLTATADNSEITRFLTPHVVESLRLEVREAANHATRFIAFEKALTIPDQPIEVDPSRGVFLLDRAQELKHSSTTFSFPEPDFGLLEVDAPAGRKQQPSIIRGPAAKAQAREYGVSRENQNGLLDLDLESIEDVLARLVEEKKDDTPVRPQSPQPQPSSRLQRLPPETREDTRGSASPFASELPGELAGVFFPGDLGSSQASPRQPSDRARPLTTKSSEKSPSGLELLACEAGIDSGPARFQSSEPERSHPEPNAAGPSAEGAASRASDLRIDAALAAGAVEALVGPTKTRRANPEPATPTAAQPSHLTAAQDSVDSKSFIVLLIDDEAESCEMIVQSLNDFTIEKIHDGVSGLAKLISYKSDLVVLDVDLPVIDGFKVLAHIRASLNVPVIILSSTLVRSSDDVLATERGVETNANVNLLSKALAASGFYHLTKPFTTKELRLKARQLIARYHGIDSRVISPATGPTDSPASTSPSDRVAENQHPLAGHDDEQFTSYNEFVAEVEKRVKAVIHEGSALSIVGCRVPQMTTKHGDIAQLRLREVVRDVVRDTDLTSTNAPGDVVILLADAGATGAQAFATRLRETVAEKMNQDPSVWMRSFPELEEAAETASSPVKPTNGNLLRRRASDRKRA